MLRMFSWEWSRVAGRMHWLKTLLILSHEDLAIQGTCIANVFFSIHMDLLQVTLFSTVKAKRHMRVMYIFGEGLCTLLQKASICFSVSFVYSLFCRKNVCWGTIFMEAEFLEIAASNFSFELVNSESWSPDSKSGSRCSNFQYGCEQCSRVQESKTWGEVHSLTCYWLLRSSSCLSFHSTKEVAAVKWTCKSLYDGIPSHVSDCTPLK